MLLKWLFTLLAILWLIQALRPYLSANSGNGFKPPAPPPPPQKKDDDGEYIDYEEIK